MSGALFAIDLIAAAGIAVKEYKEEAEEEQGQGRNENSGNRSCEQVPLALAASLLSTRTGASLALAVVRYARRNWPPVVLLGVIGEQVWTAAGVEDAPCLISRAGTSANVVVLSFVSAQLESPTADRPHRTSDFL
jgi:hypothetical protein